MERDDIIEYSLDAHHSEEAGKKIRKKIWQVTALLTAITAIEVFIGVVWSKTVLTAPGSEYANGDAIWYGIKILYIVLTIGKAGFIVMSFMHLGDERKSFKWTIIVPYAFLIMYAIFILVTEAKAVFPVNFN